MLDDLVLPSKCHQICTYSGSDSLEHCLDKKHFMQYPFNIVYEYNSRGFRDSEWPSEIENLKSAIWCLGDSFTVGIGQAFENIWPQVLQRMMYRRTINVSMDGASNYWISRRARQILAEIKPKTMILMWSYASRSEDPNSDLSDEHRRKYSCTKSIFDAVCYLCNEIEYFSQLSCNIIQCIVPDGMLAINSTTLDQIWNDVKGPSWPKSPPRSLHEYTQLAEAVKHELKNFYKIDSDIESLLGCENYFNNLNLHPKILGEIPRLDLARDGHHFDLITANFCAAKIKDLLI